MNKHQLLIAEALNSDRWIKSESEMQACTARLLDALGLLWFHPANERNCTPQRGTRLKRAGVKPGVPDIIIFDTILKEGILLQIGCAIELKYGKNRSTNAQKKWLVALQENGWYADIAYNMADLIAILEACGYIDGC